MGVCEGKEDALDTDFVPLDTRLSVDNMFPEFLAQMSQLLPIQDFARLRATCLRPSKTEAFRKFREVGEKQLLYLARAARLSPCSAEQLANGQFQRPPRPPKKRREFCPG
ncbi:unnamed protein product [Effrenium voratum]|nr:unnamed protein product [Effrenium voratum]